LHSSQIPFLDIRIRNMPAVTRKGKRKGNDITFEESSDQNKTCNANVASDSDNERNSVEGEYEAPILPIADTQTPYKSDVASPGLNLLVFKDNSSTLTKLSEESVKTKLGSKFEHVQCIYPYSPDKDMTIMKKNFDEWFQVDYNKDTLSLLISDIPVKTNPPVLVVYSDCSCKAFLQGLDYARDISSTHEWATIHSYEESDDPDYITALALLKNTQAKKKAKEYGELPLISERVAIELNPSAPSQGSTGFLSHNSYAPSFKQSDYVMQKNHMENKPTTSASPSSAQKTRMMLKEQRDRGSHVLKVYIAKPHHSLQSTHQLIFFDFFNESKKQSYWTFKPDDLSAIFSELRKNEDIDDFDMIRNVFHYPRSDPANTYNQLVFKGGRQVKNNIPPTVPKKESPTKEYDIRQSVFGFSISYSASITDIERKVKGIISFICSPLMQELYHEHKERSSQSFRDEIIPGGPMWKALNASLSAIKFENVQHLDEVITFYQSTSLCTEYLPVEGTDIDQWTNPVAKSFASKMYATGS
jgi:hypothetical protein